MIGILGGSFDPPHDGHKFISQYAMMRLNLQEVWWIVTYKNPLKIKKQKSYSQIRIGKRIFVSEELKLLEIERIKIYMQ